MLTDKISDDFVKELIALLNKYSIDNVLHTPDFILASYLSDCLFNLGQIVNYARTTLQICTRTN